VDLGTGAVHAAERMLPVKFVARSYHHPVWSAVPAVHQIGSSKKSGETRARG
jgi:hypothetical protein